jgi:hypothetical protein
VRWSRGRIALSLVAVALICGAIAGGYALGSTGVPDQSEAVAQRQDSARAAFLASRDAAFEDKLGPGRHDGRATGAKEGASAGARRGRAAGQLAAQNAAHPSSRTTPANGVATGRSETESEIGGIGGGGGLPAAGTGSVLVVGDSLEVLTSPYLKQYLPGVHLTVNAVGGYSSLQIFELFRQSYDPSQNVIVFDAGTNDNPSYPEILAGRLQAVASIVGNKRCMVVPTIHGLSVGGVDSSGKNQVVRSFAASRPGTQTPDWAGFEATHPELMQPDDLHPIAAGADARARLIAQGVKRCLEYEAAIGG